MKRLYISVVIILILFVIGLGLYTDADHPQNVMTGFNPLRIAHAGGGINSKTYTNSYEAINNNLMKGFLYFEIDFSFTKDDRLVCLHDWKHDFKRSFGFEVHEKATLEEFERLIDEKSEFTKCTLDGLAAWLNDNPSAYIVTDVKEGNIGALKMIYQALPNAKRRVIPQIYAPENFSLVKELGFDQIIWTLYRFRGTNDEVLNWIENFYGPFAITMPKYRAESKLPRELKRRHVPTYVHTVNTLQEVDNFITKFEVTEIYTDFYNREFDKSDSRNLSENKISATTHNHRPIRRLSKYHTPDPSTPSLPETPPAWPKEPSPPIAPPQQSPPADRCA